MKSSVSPEDVHHKANSNKLMMNAVSRLFPIGSKARALARKKLSRLRSEVDVGLDALHRGDFSEMDKNELLNAADEIKSAIQEGVDSGTSQRRPEEVHSDVEKRMANRGRLPAK